MASPKEATATVYAPAAVLRSSDGSADEIPVRITLGDSALAMGANGLWHLEHSPLEEYVNRVKALTEHNQALQEENVRLKDRCLRLTEESNMEKFKCQLLVEMLALSSLDEERSRGEVELERVKMSSMKNDLQALMDEARRQGVDVRKLAAVLSVP